jgi:hypothetical protein
MENKFNHDEFEHFIKENADQYRMFPSEKVWKGINQTINTRTRWYGFALGFLILTISVVTWVMLSNSNRNRPVISSLPPLPAVTVTQPKTAINFVLPPARPSNNKLAFVTNSKMLQKELYSFEEVFSDNNEEPSALTYIADNSLPVSTTVTNQLPSFKSEVIAGNDHITTKIPSSPKQALSVKAAEFTFTNEKMVLPVSEINTEIDKNVAAVKEDMQRNRSYDVPWTIESVINAYKHTRKSKKLSFMAYVTPTITYRNLKENTAFISWAASQTNGFTNATYSADINNIVKHKADLGIQLGLSTGIPVTKNLKLIAGVQFNVSKYDIRAYTTPGEQATVSLSSASGGRNTMTTTSYYRNVGAREPNWLRNLYISASLPVGVEYKILGNRRNYFGVAATVQPTYILTNKSYLLTTDYKNYAKFPSLTRKVNLNAGFEMFAGITTGKVKWKIGPQARYQVMSSYQDRYPIKEHLFDFGLKMGILLNR